MNKVIIGGRATRDPDVRHGQNGKAVCKYTVAVERIYKKEGEPTADFVNVVGFGDAAEFAEKYIRKGTKILITGRIQTGSFTNKEGNKVYTTDVVIEHQEFMESKRSSGTSENPQTPAPSDNDFMSIPDALEDELPFN